MTDEEKLRARVKLESLPREVSDQKGRVWSRWMTLVPGDYRVCGKCGRRIELGYVLEPHVRTAICAHHVHRRWV